MPYCESCEHYHAPSALAADGSCPKCGTHIAESVPAADADGESVPWHFKLLVGAVVVYLGWRAVQLIGHLV